MTDRPSQNKLQLADVVVTLLSSIHDVMALERLLRESGVVCDLIPVPRQLSSECGMAVEIQAASATKVADLARAEGIPVEGFFAAEGDGYILCSLLERTEEG